MQGKEYQIFSRKSYWIAIVVSLVFLAVGLFFIFYAGNQSQQETLKYISEAVQESRFNIDEHINGEFQALRTGMILNDDRDWLAEDESFKRMTSRLLDSNPYTRAGIVAPDGEALWVNSTGENERANLADEIYIQQALAGEDAISETQWDETNGVNVNNYAVPVYNEDGTIRGAMFASDPEDEIRAVMDNTLFAGEGMVQIVENNGDYVVVSHSPLRLAGDGGLFDLPVPLEQGEKQIILDNMQAGRSGYLEYDFNGDSRMVAYEPSQYNDWYIFYAVPDDRVNAGLKNIMEGMVILIAAAVTVFLFFILLIRRNNEHSRKALEYLAFVDPLTGGNNMQKFKIDAQKILDNKPNEQHAILYGDIKRFKYINDIFGREIGDRLLRYLWGIILEESKEGEVCAHAGADVFVALRRYKHIEAMTERSLKDEEKMAQFSETLAQNYKFEMYTGVYVIDKRDGPLTLDDMIDRAQEAQQKVKRSNGGEKIGFYSNGMRAQKLWEMEVESKMGQALADSKFQVYLQPKINIQEKYSVMGMEALVRWEAPGQEMMAPHQYIGLFERNGFIVQLDRYMMEYACRIYREERFAEEDPPLVMSVNVSRLGLLQPDIVQVYTDIKEKYEIPDGLVELELTESLLFENETRFREVVEEMRRRGFLCSLDDFGAGYSSLNILKAIRVDVLKLDKQFFAYGNEEERGRALVGAIVSLAKRLGVKTVAEGVEDMGEVRWLRKAGCDAVQGYVFSRPLPPAKFKAFLREWKNRGAKNEWGN